MMTVSYEYLHELEIQVVAHCYWKLVGFRVVYLLQLVVSALGCLAIQGPSSQTSQQT